MLGTPPAALMAQERVTGADIDERTDAVLHVDQRHAEAGDRNDGSDGSPLRTVGEAARRAMDHRSAGRGAKVLIHPGTYRETVHVGADEPDPDAPAIIFEGSEAGDVAIRGSDVWTDWQREEQTNLYRHAWPHRWGLAELPRGWDAVADQLEENPVVLRGEMVFVDGQPLRQVMTTEAVRDQPGTFHVREAGDDEESGTLWIHPAEGFDLAEATVEVAVRPELFIADNLSQLVVRNLVFEHAATQLQGPAVQFRGCENVLMEDCRIEWNNWNALAAFGSRNITWRRLATNHNGAGGMGGWRVRNLRVEQCEASHNNWRGAWGGFRGWATGQKFLSLHGARFTDYEAVGNEAVGLWFDGDVRDVLVERANLSRNATRGLFLEVMQGPLTLRDSRIRENGADGVFVTTAARITFEGNRIADNADHQIHFPWLADEHIEREVTNFRTGEVMAIRTKHWTLQGNTIAGQGDGLLLAAPDWEHFLQTLSSDRNRWHHPDREDAFGLVPGEHQSPETMDLMRWRARTGQDRRSRLSTADN